MWRKAFLSNWYFKKWQCDFENKNNDYVKNYREIDEATEHNSRKNVWNAKAKSQSIEKAKRIEQAKSVEQSKLIEKTRKNELWKKVEKAKSVEKRFH